MTDSLVTIQMFPNLKCSYASVRPPQVYLTPQCPQTFLLLATVSILNLTLSSSTVLQTPLNTSGLALLSCPDILFPPAYLSGATALSGKHSVLTV